LTVMMSLMHSGLMLLLFTLFFFFFLPFLRQRAINIKYETYGYGFFSLPVKQRTMN
jgi:hypothetical protein